MMGQRPEPFHKAREREQYLLSSGRKTRVRRAGQDHWAIFREPNEAVVQLLEQPPLCHRSLMIAMPVRGRARCHCFSANRERELVVAWFSHPVKAEEKLVAGAECDDQSLRYERHPCSMKKAYGRQCNQAACYDARFQTFRHDMPGTFADSMKRAPLRKAQSE